MNRLRRWWHSRQDGNAVLFSLIIMAAAMVISLGMVSLVASEVRSVSLVLPSERAYYKAESYVEQALWQKKQDPNYEFNPATVDGKVSPPVGQQLPATYLCDTAPCATTNPTDQPTLLKEFYATSSPLGTTVSFPADTPQQYDILQSGTTGAGTVSLTNITGGSGYDGLEVTIVAYPTANAPASQYPVSNPTTPVFVDKIEIPADQTSDTISINTGQKNALGESYPSLDSTNIYRLRIRALGADASAGLAATNSAGNALTLQSPDFTVRSVALDSNSERGIQVIVPQSAQVASIFDFVLFSDLDLTKLNAKAAGTKLIAATISQDQNGNCTVDATDPGIAGVFVTAHPNSGPDSTATSGSDGVAVFSNLQAGMTYTVTPTFPSGMIICNPPGTSQSVTFTNNASNEAKSVSFLARTPRAPFYRFYNWTGKDHFYTAAPCTAQNSDKDNGCGANGTYIAGNPYYGGWTYEMIAGYLYTTNVSGTGPLYQAYNDRTVDHYYTMSTTDFTTWLQKGYSQQGTAGYLDALNSNGTCPTGTAPLYHVWINESTDNFYTMDQSEYNSVKKGNTDLGITGCMWTIP